MGGDTNINGIVLNELGRFDLGIAFGTAGIGRDDIRQTSFLLSGPSPLSLDMLNSQDLGQRFTSVGLEGGGRNDGAKIGGETGTVAQNDVLAVAENATVANAGNLLANDGTAGTNSVSAAQWSEGGAFASGPSGALTSVLVKDGKSFGTITINPDGTVALDANGADVDALALGETRNFTFTYTSRAPDGSLSTSTARVTLIGANDAPAITSEAAATAGTVVEAGEADDGTAVAGTPQVGGQLTAKDVDTGASLSWSATGSSGYGGFTLNSATGAWTFTLDQAAAEGLAEGAEVQQTFTVTVTDEHRATAQQVVTVTIRGTNDGPTLAAGTLDATEDGAAVSLDLTALGDDPDGDDDGASLLYAVTSVTRGSATVEVGRLVFDPGQDFQHLAKGETAEVDVVVSGSAARASPSAPNSASTTSPRARSRASERSAAGPPPPSSSMAGSCRS